MNLTLKSIRISPGRSLISYMCLLREFKQRATEYQAVTGGAQVNQQLSSQQKSEIQGRRWWCTSFVPALRAVEAGFKASLVYRVEFQGRETLSRRKSEVERKKSENTALRTWQISKNFMSCCVTSILSHLANLNVYGM